MKFVLISGAPAVGKYTVARELAQLTGYLLFHNHLTVDLVLSVYDFGTPGFVALREQIWFSVIRRALADRLPGLIFTFNPENSVPQRFIDELFAEVSASGADLVSVELVASEAEIERRLSSESRRKFKKLTELDLYQKLRAAGTFLTPVLPTVHMRIDTERTSPGDAAAQIAASLHSRS